MTGMAAVTLCNSQYIKGSFEGFRKQMGKPPVALPILQIQQKDIADLDLEILSYDLEIKDGILAVEAISGKVSEEYSPYCTLTFSCEGIRYCWNEFVEDAWFQE